MAIHDKIRHAIPTKTILLFINLVTYTIGADLPEEYGEQWRHGEPESTNELPKFPHGQRDIHRCQKRRSKLRTVCVKVVEEIFQIMTLTR
jgi:hypothetical protein